MIKIFETGDNHIGLAYSNHNAAQVLHDERIAAFKGMVDKANEENCDFFVITGDLFENISQVPKKDVAALVTILKDFSGIVLVLPGNHDYLQSGSETVWKYFKDETSACHNIVLMDKDAPYTYSVREESIIFYPAVCDSRHCAENKLGWIKEAIGNAESDYKIGVAHGAIDTVTPDADGIYFKMSRQELESIPADVWLIGHTHVQYPDNVSEDYKEVGRILNAGTHVQRDPHNSTEGVCFIVKLESEDGRKTVKTKKWNSSNLRFYRPETLHVPFGGSLKETLENALKDYGDFSCVEAEVAGAVSDDEYNQRADIIDSMSKRFIECSIGMSGITRIIDNELIDKEFPETEIGNKLLKALSDDPQEAQMVYNVLKNIG